MVKENVWSPQNTDGFLTRNEADYFQFIDDDQDKLAQLL